MSNDLGSPRGGGRSSSEGVSPRGGGRSSSEGESPRGGGRSSSEGNSNSNVGDWGGGGDAPGEGFGDTAACLGVNLTKSSFTETGAYSPSAALLAALETPTNEEEWSPVVEKSPGGEWTINDSEPAYKVRLLATGRCKVSKEGKASNTRELAEICLFDSIAVRLSAGPPRLTRTLNGVAPPASEPRKQKGTAFAACWLAGSGTSR